jgi:WavE lipopolysaccharide synthesis
MMNIKRLSVLKSYKSVIKHVLYRILELLEEKEGRFYTIHWRPKFAEDIVQTSIERHNEDSIGVVMQGPLILKDNFTYNSCKLYCKFFPNSKFILSTWIGEDVSTIDKIRNLGWIVILNEPPTNRGYANINMQIKSTFAGISEMKKLYDGIKFVVKTRTDQRIYNKNALQFFLGLWKAFPTKDTNKQKGRLIVPMGTPILRLYGVGDMIMFGHVDDMASYWGAPYDGRKASDLVESVSKCNTVLSFAKLELSEVYLATNYLRKLGLELTWELSDSWKAIGDYFIVTGHSPIDLFWHKNSLHLEFKHRYYTINHTWNLMDFADWLLLYQRNYSANSMFKKAEDVIEGASLEQPDTIHVQGKLT